MLDKGLDARRNNQDPVPGQGRGDVANGHRSSRQPLSRHQVECLLIFDEGTLVCCVVFVVVQEKLADAVVAADHEGDGCLLQCVEAITQSNCQRVTQVHCSKTRQMKTKRLLFSQEQSNAKEEMF